MKKNLVFLWRSPLYCILLVLLSACAQVNPAAAQLDEAERKWQAQGIRGYVIEVFEVRSVWHAQTQKIVVVDNKVSAFSASCIPAPMEGGSCKLKEFDPRVYTVEGLFAQARAQLKSDQAKWLKISYAPEYAFPVSIAFDDPNIVDEDWIWSVKKFEVQK